MNKITNLLKSLLVAAGLLVGGANAWGDVTPVLQDYSGGVADWTSGNTGRYTVDMNAGGYLTVKDVNNGNNGATITGSTVNGKAASGVDFASSDDFTMIFDLQLNGGNNQPSWFHINDATNSNGGNEAVGTHLLTLNQTAANSTTWKINGSESQTVSLTKSTWYTFKLTKSSSSLYLTVTPTAGGDPVFARQTVTVNSTVGGLGNMVFQTKRYYSFMAIDNVVVREIEEGDIPAAPPTTYTIKFQNAGGTTLKSDVVYDTFVGETFTASVSDMATFYNGDESKKYVYKSGNTSTAAVVTAASNVITLVFDEYSKVDYTVTAKNGDETLGTLASGSAYTDGSTKVYWNKFKQFNDEWYVTTGSYGTSITAAGDVPVSFTPSTIAYFYEFETLSRNGGASTVTESDINKSNNTVGRIANSSGSYATLYTPTLSGGVYDLSMPYYNGNSVSDGDKFYVYVTNDIASLGDPVETFSIEKRNDGNFAATISVPTGYFVAFQGAPYLSSNSKARVDYMTLTKQHDLVSLIGLNGDWATDNLMDYDGETHKYTKTVTGFKAKAGINYEYKIRDYGTWDSFQFPATGLGNKSFSVDADGTYTLAFTADRSTGAVTVTPTRTGDYENVVTFVNAVGWPESNVSVYAWTGENKNADWPGEKINKVGTYQGYDVHAYIYETKYENIIFSNDGSDQTSGGEELVDGKQYSKGTILPYHTVIYTNPEKWENVYAYTWTIADGDDMNADWPGVKMMKPENDFVYGFNAETLPTKIIFNNGVSGAGNQTDNLKFYDGLTYSFGAKGSTVPVTISSAGYATYASAATLNFAGSGITAYRAEETDGAVTFSEQSWVPAGTGLLLKAEPGTYNIPTATSDNEDYAVSSALIGVVKTTTIEDAGIFVLMNGASGVGFYKTTSAFTVGANTAYFAALPTTARFFSIDEVGTTSISEQLTVNSEKFATAPVYNLQGQRVAQPRKGLYIVNGKKVIKN